MIRRIIKIGENLCSRCGARTDACHEGVIAMIDGRVRLIKDDYCDELGDCLSICPTGVITFEEREAAVYDEAVVRACMHQGRNLSLSDALFHRECPESRSTQWPVQIKLALVQAPYFKDARLLVAANCTALAYGNFHNDFIAGCIILTGRPKLDTVDYSEKLMEIIRPNDIRDATIVRMEVPCCDDIENAAKCTLQASGKFTPWQVVTVRTDGSLVRN